MTIRNFPKRLVALTLSVTTVIFSAGCSVFGVESVEEAPYQLVSKQDRFEVREYEPYVVVQTSVEDDFRSAGNTAFNRLFAYISGKNQSQSKIAMTAPVLSEESIEPNANTSEKIAMTAPVLSEKEGGSWLYQFVLPKTFTIDNSPLPLDPNVELAQVPSKRVAAIRFAGRMTDTRKDEFAEQLLEWTEAQGLSVQSAPRWAGYNAPWALPPFRRNEALVDVSAN